MTMENIFFKKSVVGFPENGHQDGLVVQICHFDSIIGRTECSNENKENGYGAFSLCGLNQYCSPEGMCTDLTSHPHYHHTCVSDHQCNHSLPGLTCFNRTCQICYPDGMQLAHSDKDIIVCKQGRWLRSIPTITTSWSFVSHHSVNPIHWELLTFFFVGMLSWIILRCWLLVC